MSYEIFGYGSLILPYSVIARFSDEIPSVDPIYEARTRYEENGIIRPKAKEVFNNSFERISFKPVKIEGFLRAYSHESERGGAMLEAYYTGRSTDIINGVIISGLKEHEYEAISDYESAYDKYEIDPDEFNTYESADIDPVETGATIYLGGQSEQSNWDTDRVRNQTYHSRILKGISYLGDKYNEELAEQFWKDFVMHTYEHPSKTVDLEYEELNSV